MPSASRRRVMPRKKGDPRPEYHDVRRQRKIRLHLLLCDLLDPAEDSRLFEAYGSDFTPCGCVAHRPFGVDCTVVEIVPPEIFRCLACGETWSMEWLEERSLELRGTRAPGLRL